MKNTNTEKLLTTAAETDAKIRAGIKEKMMRSGPQQFVEVTAPELAWTLRNDLGTLIMEVEKERACTAKQNAAQCATDAAMGATMGPVGLMAAAGEMAKEPDHKAHLDRQYDLKEAVNAATPSFEDVVTPVVEYLRANHCPHVKVIIDTDSAELVGGIEAIVFEPEFNEEVTPENIQVGDFITVREWTSHKDNSYKGDLLEVKKIALPHVFVERHSKYAHNCDRLQLSFDKVIFQRVNQDFIDGHNWMAEKDAA